MCAFDPDNEQPIKRFEEIGLDLHIRFFTFSLTDHNRLEFSLLSNPVPLYICI